MVIKLLYNCISEIKSQIISVEINHSNYRIAWNCIDNEGILHDAFFQSNHITSDEFEELKIDLQNQFSNKQIPLWLYNDLIDQILTE